MVMRTGCGVQRLSTKGTALLLFAYLLVPINVVRAQVQTGSVIGVARDESAAILPGVTVTLTSAAAPTRPLTTVTDTLGTYRFPSVAPGVYRLTITLEGFATYLETDLQVAVASTVERDVALKASQLAETITVTGRAPVVDATKVAVTANIPAVL